MTPCLPNPRNKEITMDLSTQYMGMTLKSPIVPSASPLSREIDRVRAMEDAGAGAVVFFSLFEEQLQMESQTLTHTFDLGSESFSEVSSFWPELPDYAVGPDAYLELLRRAKEAVDIPIIGSLNCATIGGWTEYAAMLVQAGADAIELNIYHIPTDPHMRGDRVEQLYVDILVELKKYISVPLAIKLHPFFSSIPHMAHQLAGFGADALVLFNRFYQPDFDLDKLEVTPGLVLSNSHELRLPLRWVSILFDRVDADLAITTGIHDHIDLLKAMMAGARVGMMASALLKHGIPHITTTLEDLRTWMEEHEYESIEQMQGSMSHQNVPDPFAFERTNYMKVLQSYHVDPTGQSY